jgi:hypothetical protein
VRTARENAAEPHRKVDEHPAKEEYWKEFQKREGTLEIQGIFLLKRRRLRCSKWQRTKLELTKEGGDFDAKRARAGLPYGMEANRAVMKRSMLSDPSHFYPLYK